MPAEPLTAEPACKIVVVGPPGSGKGAYVKAVAARYGQTPSREYRLAECTVVRADFLVPGPDAGDLRVTMHALTGPHHYEASDELLLRDADGILFLCEPNQAHIGRIREELLCFTEQALRCGINFSRVPVAFQYQRVERIPGFDAHRADQVLGVPTDSVPRFSATSSQPDASGQTFDAIMDRVRLVRGSDG